MTERPHEALGQTPPARVVSGRHPGPTRRASRTRGTTRRYQVRRVRPNGQIKWRGDLVFVSEAVCGELVGLAETERGDWTVRFMQVELGRIDRQTRAALPPRGTAGGSDDARGPQPWKCRARGHHRTLPTGAWKSRQTARFPHSHR